MADPLVIRSCCIACRLNRTIPNLDDADNARYWGLIELAKREIAQLGLAKPEEIEDGTVVRMPKAYPMYDHGFAKQVATIREYLEECSPNLQLVGRNGMHKYNNQDHSMMTAQCAAENILGAAYDLWSINAELDYHEEKDEHKKPRRWRCNLQRKDIA